MYLRYWQVHPFMEQFLPSQEEIILLPTTFIRHAQTPTMEKEQKGEDCRNEREAVAQKNFEPRKTNF